MAELIGPGLMSRLDRLDVLSRKVFAGKLPGERRSKRRGTSVEFDDYRNYVAGDDLRRIDWNVFARLDRFFLKLFREEEDLALHVVMDASASMDAGSGEASKLVFAQRLAMALAYIGLVNQNRVVASVIGAPGRPLVQQLAPVRGRRNVQRLGKFLLEAVWPPEGYGLRGGAPAGPLNAALRQLALFRRGKGVMVLLSDFLVREDLRAGLNFLASGGGAGGGGGGGGAYDVFCVQVLSPGEMEPEKEAGGSVIGDLRFTDAETGSPAEVTVSGALLRKYKERLELHIDGLRRAAAARGMTHVLLRSDADVERVLLEYLRRRGLLG